MKDYRDSTIINLDKQTIETAINEIVETITLSFDNNDYYQGFKIYYEDVSYQPLYGRYFRVDLLPNSNKQCYHEILLDPNQFQKVLNWSHSELEDVSIAKDDYIRNIVFSKKKPVPMTAL